MFPELTDRQRRIVALADELALRFADRVDRYDREGIFPFANFADLRDSGYLRLVAPPQYGGEGADLFEMTLAQERLARGCGATAMAVDMTIHLIGRLAETPSWREPVFEMVCRSVVDEGALINSAATEADLGSPSRGGLPATRAVPVDGGWRITGRKLFVSMAPALRWFLVSATLPPDDEAPQGAIGSFLVEAGSPGIRLEDSWRDSLSLRSSASYDLALDDVFVPAERLVECSPAGAAPRPGPPAQMAWFALTLSAVYLGIGQAACDAVCAYARERIPTALGRPIATLPNIQRRVGAMQAALSAARSVLYQTAHAWVARPAERGTMAAQIATAKYLCTNAACDATDQALRIAGGFALTRSLPLERYFRDARAGLTHPPNDDAALELIGRQTLGV
jgi:alkylation response protein AidB-like acyl-CoA dehydrogenase